MQNKYLNGISIEVVPFDLQCYGETYKLDLLYYNNVNRYGEVLTSLVYNSGVRDAIDVTKIQYEPNKLFKNTEFEQSYSFLTTETSNRWKNADLLTTGTTILDDNSYSAVYNFDHYNISSNYAALYENGKYAYDGWYSLVSVGLPTHANNAAVVAGTMRYNVAETRPEYAKVDNPVSASDWENLSVIDPEIPIYNFIRSDEGNTYDVFEFVVTVKTNTLYKKLLDNKLKGDWFVNLNVLGPKLRTMTAAIEHNSYDTAQHIINSINNSLLALLI